MYELLGFIRYCLHIYYWLIIIGVILSWLITFGMINYSNPTVRQAWKALDAITLPLLKPIRRVLPPTGGIDFSPLVLLVACVGVADFLIPFLQRTIG